MNTEKKFYVTFTAQVDTQYKSMPVGKPFKSFDTAQQFAESASEAWNRISSDFKYVNYSIAFK
jgi:hypothetical protein